MLLGLAGKSGCGKNFVGLELERRGFEVWDLDLCARDIRIRKADQVRSTFGTTDPALIAEMVFSDKTMLKALEDIIYPQLIDDILSFKGDLVINGALIHRSGLDKMCKALIYVDAPYSTRLERVIKRDGITEHQFKMRNDSQKDVDYRDVDYRCPVFVIENDGSKDVTEDLDRILSHLKES